MSDSTVIKLVKDKDYKRVHVQGVVANSRESGDIYLEWFEDINFIIQKATIHESGEIDAEPLEADYERTFYVGMTINSHNLNNVIINLLEQYKLIYGNYPDYIRENEGDPINE